MDELKNSPEEVNESIKEELPEEELTEEEFEASLKLTKKVINKMLSFVICGGIFILMLAFNIHNKLSGEVSSTTLFLRLISSGMKSGTRVGFTTP